VAISTSKRGPTRLALNDSGFFALEGHIASVEGKTMEEAIEKAVTFSGLQTPREFFTD